ncbi:MAG: T9SS type A sorting domain-containing protein [Saprospiraceae bacterium]|nr:T9SS type A sorting domain-containing protein [Saprospiraceae bacterium]MDW8228954.1 T9SS type A sorting domain-containing protein [Saprospiraceae bacterium]
MLRTTALAGFALVLGVSTAFVVASPQSGEKVAPVASTVSERTFPWLFDALGEWEQEVPFCSSLLQASNPKILLLNYSAYDSAYADKIRNILLRQIPSAEIAMFWKGSPQELAAQAAQHHVIVVPYPANDRERLARAYGKVLRQYVLRGGAVVFCGTDKFGILQQYNLFDLDFGYFCSAVGVHEDDKTHPIFRETPEDFTPINYVYPLDVSDQAYVSLANVRGYSTIGYKPMGAGKVAYIGIEYYYDEPVSSQILANAVCWLCPPSTCGPATQELTLPAESEATSALVARPIRRVEEQLYAGTGAANAAEVKIYPNPYVEKAFLEFSLDKPTAATIEMTNESGARVAMLLPYRNLNPGQYRVELPNLSPGVYFVKCQLGGQTVTRKVVKGRA